MLSATQPALWVPVVGLDEDTTATAESRHVVVTYSGQQVALDLPAPAAVGDQVPVLVDPADPSHLRAGMPQMPGGDSSNALTRPAGSSVVALLAALLVAVLAVAAVSAAALPWASLRTLARDRTSEGVLVASVVHARPVGRHWLRRVPGRFFLRPYEVTILIPPTGTQPLDAVAGWAGESRWCAVVHAWRPPRPGSLVLCANPVQVPRAVVVSCDGTRGWLPYRPWASVTV